MEAELYKVIITNAAIRTKFVIYQMRVMSIADSWIRGKIHPDLFSLVNKTLPNYEQYPYGEIVPLSCAHEAHSTNVLPKSLFPRNPTSLSPHYSPSLIQPLPYYSER